MIPINELKAYSISPVLPRVSITKDVDLLN